ncbi:hypothetical protein B0H63DRAFT_273915 [Podospora didyma]|uniref:WW domain-containing protein n=1 Tax=Podospora didyma TaxID=330526 RepID=A0AAE0KFY6_9PEZI|nr:hypothetical protein B0H63DRAFT_273915 [Podospora didyma]
MSTPKLESQTRALAENKPNDVTEAEAERAVSDHGSESGELIESPGDASANSPKPASSVENANDETSEAANHERRTSQSELADAATGEAVTGTDAINPPLPNEPAAQSQDDGWEAHFIQLDGLYWFYNRFTGVWQKDNPRVPPTVTTSAVIPGPVVPDDVERTALSNPESIAGGYNPAIHGDYDENAWYAQNTRTAGAQEAAGLTGSVQHQIPSIPVAGTADFAEAAAGALTSAGYFNRITGQWQTADQGPERHSDEAKSKRQLNTFFDVDAAANQHDGRSLKAERAGKKPTKAELKAFKEKRKAKKEEKRRAWLRD